MPRYLVIHSPDEEQERLVHPPTRLAEMARTHGVASAQPRWLRTWSPDLHDDRLFTLWDSVNADAILTTIKEFGFLDHMRSQPIAVQEWGPEDVDRDSGA